MANRLIILYRALQPLEQEEILSRTNGAVQVQILFLDKQYVPAAFDQFQQNAIENPDAQIAATIKSCLYDVIERGHRRLNGVKLLDRLSFGGQNYWFHVRTVILLKYRAAAQILKAVEYILQKTDTNAIERTDVYHANEYLRNIDTGDSNTNYHYGPDRPINRNPGKSAWKGLAFALLFIERALIGFIKFHHIFGKRKHLVIINLNDKQTIIVPDNEGLIEGDPYIEYLLIKTANDPEFAYVTEVYPQEFGTRQKAPFLNHYLLIYKYFAKSLNFESFMFLNLLNPLLYINAIRLSGKLKKVTCELQNQNGDVYDRVFISCLSSIRQLLLYQFIRVKAAELMLRLLPVKSIGGIKEQASSNKPVLSAALASGIPSYGIQHGAIIEHHHAYTFSKEDAKYTPWPQHTMVFGSYWKDVLTRVSAYPPEQLMVLGQMRTDCIPYLLTHKNDPGIHGFDPSRPIVMYASQPVIRGQERIRDRFTSDVLTLTKDHPEIQFIIRPHPSETANLNYFYQMGDRIGTSNFVISQTELYFDLAISNIVIVYFSTVGAEAIYFDKHLVLLDYLESGVLSYLNDVGFPVKNYTQLKTIVKEILEGRRAVTVQAKKDFMGKMAFTIDGRTTERYVNFIKSLANND